MSMGSLTLWVLYSTDILKIDVKQSIEVGLCPTLINHTRGYFVCMYESWGFQWVSNMGECDLVTL